MAWRVASRRAISSLSSNSARVAGVEVGGPADVLQRELEILNRDLRLIGHPLAGVAITVFCDFRFEHPR